MIAIPQSGAVIMFRHNSLISNGQTTFLPRKVLEYDRQPERHAQGHPLANG